MTARALTKAERSAINRRAYEIARQSELRLREVLASRYLRETVMPDLPAIARLQPPPAVWAEDASREMARALDAAADQAACDAAAMTDWLLGGGVVRLKGARRLQSTLAKMFAVPPAGAVAAGTMEAPGGRKQSPAAGGLFARAGRAG